MLIVVKARGMPLDDTLVDYVERKFARLDRYAANLLRAEVEASQEPTREVSGRRVVQINLLSDRGLRLRGEERAADVHAAVDTLFDSIRRRLQREKVTRQTRRQRFPGAKGIAAIPVPGIPDLGTTQPGQRTP